jgi:K+-sensing histidine kinase KdpD
MLHNQQVAGPGRTVAGGAAAAGALALGTAVLVPLRDHLGLPSVVLLYLVPVLLAAATGGRRPLRRTATHRPRRRRRLTQRLNDHTGGGLGLAIARGFTEAQGGTLVPAQTPGGGLTMTITLPAAHRDRPPR